MKAGPLSLITWSGFNQHCRTVYYALLNVINPTLIWFWNAMKSKKKLAELAPLIDEIVINDGTPTELREKAEKLYAKLVG